MIGDNLDEKLTFDEKFSALNSYFKINSYSEVYDFIKNNESIFFLIDEIKPFLEKYFSNCEYCLDIIHDPEIMDFNYLELMINVSRERFYNGVQEDIEIIRSQIRTFRRKFNIFLKFKISYGVKHV